MTQLWLLLSDPATWAAVTVILIVLVIVGEFIAAVFPYQGD